MPELLSGFYTRCHSIIESDFDCILRENLLSFPESKIIMHQEHVKIFAIIKNLGYFGDEANA